MRRDATSSRVLRHRATPAGPRVAGIAAFTLGPSPRVHGEGLASVPVAQAASAVLSGLGMRLAMGPVMAGRCARGIGRTGARGASLRARAALRVRARSALFALALVLLDASLAGPAAGSMGAEHAATGDAPAWALAAHWRVLDEWPSRGELPSALAESRQAGLAVGDAAGVSWWREGRWSRAQTPAVRDLAFDVGGRLWIGTGEGLFVWDPAARPERRQLRDGEPSNRISRIEAKDGALVVATEGGVYWSTTGHIFQSLNSGSAEQWVSWVAVRRSVATVSGGANGEASGKQTGPTPEASPRSLVEVWSFGGEGLVRLLGIESGEGLRVVGRSLWPLPRPAAEAGAVDLVVAPSGAQLYLVYPDAIAALDLDRSAQSDEGIRWRWIRPVLSPGAAIRRLVPRAAGGVWLATDHGLLAADALEDRFARASNPAGSRACSDVLEARDLPAGARAIALCHPSLLALVDAPAPPATPPSDDQPVPIHLPVDPPVAEIRARALERVGLSVERADSLWRGLRRKALWPSLQLRGAYDADEDRGQSRDQSFVSGETRNLRDRDQGEGVHYAAGIVFDWELGGIAYPDDAVDLYRELRQVTSLRDDVSDEIHQLYFERQRIRARLAQAEILAPGEAAELTLRAEELDSGLDAWTGGWLRNWRRANELAAPIAHPGRLDRSID